jgi:hypothetical protein
MSLRTSGSAVTAISGEEKDGTEQAEGQEGEGLQEEGNEAEARRYC